MPNRALSIALLLACAHHDSDLPPPQTDPQREAAQLERQQREYFEEYHTTQRRDCPRRCTLASAVCSKARRTCALAEANPGDEALPGYCMVAQARCEKADSRLRFECVCWSTGPRMD